MRELDDWIDSYLLHVENTEPADMFKLWTAIFTISACLKRKCQLKLGFLTVYPNIYVVLVGPPGGSRKGTAMGPGYNMLEELNVHMAAEATTREALVRELCRCGSETDIETTKDGKTKVNVHSSLVIFSQELSVFLGYKNLALMSDLTDWFDCKSRWKYSTKDQARSDDIMNVWVALFGATTPKMIQTNLPDDAVGLGLTSRIIFVYEGKKGKVVPVPFLTEAQEVLRPQLMHDLEQILMMRGTFSYSKDFLEGYIEWRLNAEEHPPFNDDRLAGYVDRRPIHLLKLSMIMSASRSNDMFINRRDLERAIFILNATEKKMPQVFSGHGRNPLAPTMQRALQIIITQKEIAYDDLYRQLSNDVSAQMFDQLVQSLEMAKVAQVVQKGSKRMIVKIGGNLC